MDGWVDGWGEGWMHRWCNVQVYVCTHTNTHSCACNKAPACKHSRGQSTLTVDWLFTDTARCTDIYSHLSVLRAALLPSLVPSLVSSPGERCPPGIHRGLIGHSAIDSPSLWVSCVCPGCECNSSVSFLCLFQVSFSLSLSLALRPLFPCV